MRHWRCRLRRTCGFPRSHANSVTAIVDAGQVPIDADLMGTLANLDAIIHFRAAYETIDVGAGRRFGIGVSNTPDAPRRRRGALRARCSWPLDGPYPFGHVVTGSRVGILGLGRIGSAIAHRLTGFNCPIA